MFNLHNPKALHSCFQKEHSNIFCLLSKVCLCADADWLRSSVNKWMVRGQYNASSAPAIQAAAVDSRGTSKYKHLVSTHHWQFGDDVTDTNLESSDEVISISASSSQCDGRSELW